MTGIDTSEASRSPSLLTMQEAADDLRTTVPALWRLHREGALAVVYLSGTNTPGRRGAKNGRVSVEELERFKKARNMSIRIPTTSADNSNPAKSKRGRPRANAINSGGFLDDYLKETGRKK